MPVVEFTLDPDHNILVELPDDFTGVTREEAGTRSGEEAEKAPITRSGGKPEKVLERTEQSFTDAVSAARRVGDVLVEQFQSAKSRPQEFEVEFGLQLSAEAGAILTSVGANAHLHIRMKWQAPDSEWATPDTAS